MIKVKRDYYLSLTVICILIGILIGGFLYLLNHAFHHKEYAIYYYMAAFLLFILGIVLGVILKAEIYCFPLRYAAAKETFTDERIQVIINECIKKGVVISISSEEIIKCICKQDEENDFHSTKDNLDFEKSKQDFRNKYGSVISIATAYEFAKQYSKSVYPQGDKYHRIIELIYTKTYDFYEGIRKKKFPSRIPLDSIHRDDT